MQERRKKKEKPFKSKLSVCFDLIEKDEINVPIALNAFRDGDQGPSKVTKTELDLLISVAVLSCPK